jgi:gliding motility-associated-like protein
MRALRYLGAVLLLCVMVNRVRAQGPELKWVKNAGGTYADMGYSVAADKKGNVYATGIFSGVAQFDPPGGSFTLNSPGSDDNVFISKQNSDGDFLWVKQFTLNGGAQYVFVRSTSIVTDTIGNVIVLGYFGGDIDFDPGPGNTTLSNPVTASFFVCKLDPNGAFMWVKEMASPELGGAGYPSSMAIDAEGSIFATGYLYKTTDFDPGPGSFLLTPTGNSDIFVFKLKPDGELDWAKQMGGNGTCVAYGIAVDGRSNVYTTGCFTDTADFDPGPGTYKLITPGNPGTYGLFVSRLDEDGNFVWAKHITATNQANPYDRNVGEAIFVDSLGNSYSTGYFYGVTDFDPGGGVFNLTSDPINGDAFILHLNASGGLEWVRQMSGPSHDAGADVAMDAAGDIFILGYFQDQIDIDPGPAVVTFTSNPYGDMFLSKLDNTGELLWSKHISGPNYEYGNSLALDGLGSIYITGRFKDTVDFDTDAPGGVIGASGSEDIFIARYFECIPVQTSLVLTGPDSVCPFSTHHYSVEPVAGAASYTWVLPSGWTGSSTSQSIDVNIAAPGTIMVRVNGICDTSAFQSMAVGFHNIPVLITLQEDILGTANSESYVQWQWFLNDTPVPNGADSLCQLTVSGIYKVIVTDIHGCNDTATFLWEAPPVLPCVVRLPDAFTPNGDGKNDLFGVITNKPLRAYKLQIFDRWGKKVFISFNQSVRWDGSYKGTPLTIGSYFYSFTCQCDDGGLVDLTGDISLVR